MRPKLVLIKHAMPVLDADRPASDPLFHASLTPDEYRGLLGEIGSSVVAYVEDDPDCGLHTIWLAKRTDR